MILNDRCLRFLHEAWRCGSMRAAADALDVAPSSISRQIAQLEAETGTALIEHGRRELRLTEAGHAVIDYYRARLASAELLEDQLADLSSARTGHIGIAIGEGFLGSALNDTLDDFISGHPRITLGVNVTDTTNMMRLMLEDEVHFGLGFHPVPHPQIVSRYRAAVPLLAIMDPAHPLAARSRLTMAELCSAPLALMGPSFRMRQMIDEAATSKGQMIAPVVTSNSIALLIRMALNGRALTVLPAFSVSAELGAGKLAARPIDAPQLQAVYVHLLARRNRRIAPHLIELADQLRKRLLPQALAI